MKRGQPLQRRTPLRSSSQLRSGLPATQPLARKRIKPVSVKNAATKRERTKLLAPLREAQTWCSRCGVTGVGLDAHELLSRARGGATTDLANIVLLCRRCHDDVTFRHHEIPDADRWVLSRGAA